MEATKEGKIPNPKLREGTINTNVFILKFKTEEDENKVRKVLFDARISRFGTRMVDGEAWTLVGKDAILELKKHKDLNYEVW